MKKIISLLAFTIMIATTVVGQSISTMPLVAGDTVTNTATVSKMLPGQFSGGYSGVVIQPVLSKISGTLAGKIYLYEALDGVNYGSPVDSIVNTDQNVNTRVFRRSAPITNYYKVTVVGSGTMSAQIRINYGYKIYQITN